MASLHITSVRFSHYKAFSSFAIHLQEFNVLVGPNNSGKSTIVSAFRILHEGLRKAKAKSPERLEVDGLLTLGYRLNIEELPVASENIFHNYDESRPASVVFKLSNDSSLKLHFPERGSCIMVAEPKTGDVRSPKDFRSKFDLDVAFVPILGPVDQREPLFAREAARLALMTNGASRNFRNIWYHYPEDFDRFRELVQRSWPGMDILRPEISDGRQLNMYCPEERYHREICWSGYGFQVWCQMLTFIVKASSASLLVIDEPDIYLHSDLQRQLVALLRELGPDILIATHSTEIIAECEPTSLLNINKRKNMASRVKDVSQLKRVFTALGSNLNPTLTQLAKTKRVVFVEGLDFQLLSVFARSQGLQRLANRSDFAVVQTEGFNPRRAVDLAAGIEKTVGSKVLRAVVLDRDYRSDAEIADVKAELEKNGFKVHIHGRKEIENYLLVPSCLQAALESRLREKARRGGTAQAKAPDVQPMLAEAMGHFRHDVFAQRLARFQDFKKRTASHLDSATVNAALSKEFEQRWNEAGGPETLVPGKEVLARLNSKLQDLVGVTITDSQIANQFTKTSMPSDLRDLLSTLDRFGMTDPPET
ncbi:putative ATPase [Mitsuaria sp. BK045]|uniref:ATP-dependent nuclease n=1 Tax=unclassified Roseateles TaxID=2626991 RepID=UPI00161DDB16|nr:MULTISPECIES: ATP-binding protein [unclassified Roseateles]MBB3293915.1 putative ATPase [Mitsuaria sp. BK041]MBB3363132.1 putative ATPase [Mitsuaria sp. BK045]